MTRMYKWLRQGTAAVSAATVAFAIAGPVQAQNQPPQAPSAKDAKDNTKDAKDSTKDAKNSAKDSANQAKDAASEGAQKSKDNASNTKDAAKDSAQSAKNQANKEVTNAKDTAKGATQDARNSAAQQSKQNERDAGRDNSRDARNQGEATTDRTSQPTRDAQNRDSQYRDNQSRDNANRDAKARDNQPRDNRNSASQNRDARNDSRDSRSSSQATFRASEVRSADIGLWFDRSARDGLVISDVSSQGAIAKLGFREGDRIVSVNGQRVARDNDFIQYLFADNVRNERVKVIVLRDSQEEVVYVQPNVLVEEYSYVQNDPLEHFGVIVDDRYDDRIVVWKVVPRSPAYYAGIRAGDVLVTFRGQPLASRQDFVRVVTNLDEGSVPVQVKRGDRTRDYAVEVPRFDSRAERRTAMRPNLDVERPNENRESRIEDRRENRVEERSDNRPDNRPAAPLRPRR